MNTELIISICFASLVLAFHIINGRLLTADCEKKIKANAAIYERMLKKEQDINEHLTNCFLQKQGSPPIGTDIKAERETRIAEEKQRRELKQNAVQIPNGISPIQQAQIDAQKADAIK